MDAGGRIGSLRVGDIDKLRIIMLHACIAERVLRQSVVMSKSVKTGKKLAFIILTSLMALAVQIDNKTEEEQMANATAAAMDRSIDLTPIAQGMKECTLLVKEGETPILSVDTGTNRFTAQLSPADMNRMNLVLSDSTLTGEEKKERISGIVGNIALNAQLSQDYHQGMSQHTQSENISIR